MASTPTQVVRERIDETVRSLDKQQTTSQQPRQVFQYASQMQRVLTEIRSEAQSLASKADSALQQWDQFSTQTIEAQQGPPELNRIVRELAQSVRDFAQQYERDEQHRST